MDLDAIYSALSGLPWYDKPDCLLPFVASARDAVLDRLQRASNVRHAWVIASAPKREERDRLRQRLNAEVVVLAVNPHECIRRIQSDERRADRVAQWQELVQRWWRAYEPEG